MLLPVPRYGENMRVPPQIGICSYLVNFGHEVSWVIWSEGERRVPPFLLNGVRVYVTPDIHYFPGRSLPARMLNKIPNAIRRTRYALSLFKEGSYNLILVRDDVLDGLVAVHIKNRYKVPLVLHLSNPLGQAWEYHKGKSKRYRVLYYVVDRLVRLVAHRLLREADLILPTTKWFGQHLAGQGLPRSRIVPYPNGVNVGLFQGRDGRDVRARYSLSDSAVVIYVGTLDKARQLKVLIEAFAMLRAGRERAKLLVVGKGDDEGNLKDLTGQLGIDKDVIFSGQVAQSEVADFVAAADVGVCPVPPLSFYKLSSPIKLFEYMAAGKPVVANEEIPEHKEVLEQSGGGILVPFTAQGFAGGVMELLNNPGKAAEMGERGRDWVAKNRTYEVLARRLESAFYRVLQEGQQCQAYLG